MSTKRKSQQAGARSLPVPGFADSRQPGDLYPVSGIKNHSPRMKSAKYSGDFSLNKDDWISIKIRTAPDELVRFPENPIFATFKIKGKLATVTKTKDDQDQEVITYALDPAAKKRIKLTDGKSACYLPPSVGISAFFSDISIRLDQREVPNPGVGNFQYVFQALNRLFTTKEVRQERYNNPPSRPRTNKDHDLVGEGVENLNNRGADFAKNNPHVFERGRILHSSSETAPNNVGSGTFDCRFPIATQSNISRVLTKTEIEPPYLGAGSEVEIAVFKRKPMHALVQRNDITISEYLDTSVNIADYSTNPWFDEDDIELVDLRIVYWSWIPDTEEVRKQHKERETRFKSDFPTIMTSHINPGVSSLIHEFNLKPYTRACVVAMMPEHALYYNKATNKPLAPVFHFPSSLSNIQFRLNGYPILNEAGFKNPSAGGQHDINCRAYHEELVARKLYDGTLEDMFPGPNGQGLDQAILIDLGGFDMSKNAKLEVSTLYDSQGSPTKWLMVCTTINLVKHRRIPLKNGLAYWQFNVPSEEEFPPLGGMDR